MMTIGDLLEKAGILARLTPWALVVYYPKNPEKGKFEVTNIVLPPDEEFSIQYVTPARVYPPFTEFPVEGAPEQIAGSGILMQDSAEGWVLSRGSVQRVETGLAFVAREFESIKKEGLYES